MWRALWWACHAPLFISATQGMPGSSFRGGLAQNCAGGAAAALVPPAPGGHLPVVAALLAAGADVRAVCKDGYWTALNLAEANKHADVAEALRRAAALSIN